MHVGMQSLYMFPAGSVLQVKGWAAPVMCCFRISSRRLAAHFNKLA